MTASQPVCSAMRTASSGILMSPLPITGIFTASFTARITSSRRFPHIPAFASVDVPRRLRCRGLGHARNLDRHDVVLVPARADLYGQRNPDRLANRREHAVEQRQITHSPDPPHFTTFFTGQPKLISTWSKPRSSIRSAASAITAGLRRKSARRWDARPPRNTDSAGCARNFG